MSKQSSANALAQQIPRDHLLYVIEALEDEIERIREVRDISKKKKQELLSSLIDVWQIYKNALEFEATILLLCSIR